MLVGITWLSPLSPPRLSYKGWLKQPSAGPAGTVNLVAVVWQWREHAARFQRSAMSRGPAVSGRREGMLRFPAFLVEASPLSSRLGPPATPCRAAAKGRQVRGDWLMDC